MFKTFDADRSTIERKYHNPQEPFEPLHRMQYHGYEYDPSTGLDDEQIRAGLQKLDHEIGHLPHPIVKAKAVAYVLENTRIDVNEHDYFVGFYSWGRLASDITLTKWKKELFTDKLPEIDRMMKDYNASGAITIWPDFDHVVPDWDSLVKLGFTGIRDRARRFRKLHEEKAPLTQAQESYFDGIEIQYSAIIRVIDRLYRYALNQKHEKAKKIAVCLEHLRDGAPTNIYEAMQLIYLYFMFSESIDNYQVRSLGNGLDETLYPFYCNDLKNGTFTRDEIKEYLAYFMMQWSAIGNYWGQPFYLGGTDEHGKSKINDLSYDIIEVYEELGIYNPKIQIKVNHNIPKKFLDKILGLVRKGNSSFVFCCEPGMMKAVMSYGATYEEARTMDIRGCYETGIRANEVSTITGYVNPLKAVLYVLNNGVDETSHKPLGVQTGNVENFETFEDFYAAFFKQLGHLIEDVFYMANSYEKYLGDLNPSNMYSATIVQSLKNARDGYQDGVKFNNSAILCCGLASAVDALMAVKEMVYDRKEITLSQLQDALKNNWEGYELLRAKVRNLKGKYGNGDPQADAYAKAISAYFCTKVNNQPNARGGVYKATLHSALQFVKQGELTEASPDGRKRGDEISKNASPSVGMDKNGATGLIRSIVNLVPYLYMESCCLDVMLHPSAVDGEEGLNVMKALLMTYLDNGGMSLQFNIFGPEMLIDAQNHPEKYKNLQVRVCGWNVLWNNLTRKEQDAYILRAQNIRQDG